MTTTALQTRKDSLDKIRGLLEKSAPAFAKVASKYLRPDRLLKVGLANFSRNPDLLECTPQSLLLAFMQAAELGLEPGSAKKEAHLIPFKNKHNGNKLEALFLPGYGGLVTIARRSGEIVDVEARAVYEGDVYDVDYGANTFIHKPMPPTTGEERKVVAAWARAYFKGSSHTKYVWLWRADIEKIRASSKAGDTGPWVQWYEEMAAKSAVRRLYKLLPKSDEMALAEDIDDGDDNPHERYGDLMSFASNVIDLGAGGSRTAKLKGELKKKDEKIDEDEARAIAEKERADAEQSKQE